MAIGQNDDIEPAIATARPAAAAARARSAAPTAFRLASATRLPSPAGSRAARLAANVFAMMTSAPGSQVRLVDELYYLGPLQARAATPCLVVHRHALSLQLSTGTAIDDHQITVSEPPGDNLRHAHS
jgi:hypothetical protein